MPALDLTLDLLGLAGQAKTALTGETSKATQIGAVIQGFAKKAKDYGDNMAVLQAQRDIASGFINEGLAAESDAYNTTMLYNTLEDAGGKVQEQIAAGDYDKNTPEEVKEMLAGITKDAMSSATDEKSQKVVMNWMYQNQVKFLGQHGKRYRDNLRIETTKQTEIAVFNMMKDIPEGADIDVQELQNVFPSDMNSVDRDRIVAKAAMSLALDGKSSGIDLLRKLSPTLENQQVLKQAHKHYQTAMAEKQLTGFTNWSIEQDKLVTRGMFNSAVAMQEMEQYRGQRSTASWASYITSQQHKSNIVHAKNKVDSGKKMAIYTGQYALLYGNEGRAKAGAQFAQSHMRTANEDPDKFRKILITNVEKNGTASWWNPYFNTHLLNQNVTESGEISEQSINALRTAVSLVENTSMASSDSALGESRSLVLSAQEYLQGHPNEMEAALRNAYLAEKIKTKFSPDMIKRFANTSRSQLGDMLDDKGFSNLEDEALSMDAMNDWVTTKAKRYAAHDHVSLKVAVRMAVGDAEAILVDVDGTPVFQRQPGVLEERLGAPVKEVIDHFKSDLTNLTGLLSAGEIDPDKASDVKFNLSANGHFMSMLNTKTGERYADVPIAMVGDMYKDQREVYADQEHTRRGNAKNAAVLAREHVLDGYSAQIEQVLLNDTSVPSEIADRYRAAFAALAPEVTYEDWTGMSKAKRYTLIKSFHTEFAIGTRTKLTTYYDNVSKFLGRSLESIQSAQTEVARGRVVQAGATRAVGAAGTSVVGTVIDAAANTEFAQRAAAKAKESASNAARRVKQVSELIE